MPPFSNKYEILRTYLRDEKTFGQENIKETALHERWVCQGTYVVHYVRA